MDTLQKKKRSSDTSAVDVDGLKRMVAPIMVKRSGGGEYRIVKRDDATSMMMRDNQGRIKVGGRGVRVVDTQESTSSGSYVVSSGLILSSVLLGQCMEIMKISDPDDSTRPIGQSFDSPLLLSAAQNEAMQVACLFDCRDDVETQPEFVWSRDKYKARIAAAEFGKSINADY